MRGAVLPCSAGISWSGKKYSFSRYCPGVQNSTTFNRHQVYRRFAMVQDEKHQQTSIGHGRGKDHNQVASDPDSVGVWSSLSAFIHADNGEFDATDTSTSMQGLSASLFDDACSFEVEEEEPAIYVPPPPIDATDLEMNIKAEDVIYTLKDVLPGPMKKVGAEKDKCLAALRLFSTEVEVQDPLICIRGTMRLQCWLKILADAGTVVDLHEIYIEKCTAYPIKRWVYAIWTLSLTEDLAKSVIELRLSNWWTQKYEALLREIQLLNEADQSGVTEVQKHKIDLTESCSHEISPKSSKETTSSSQINIPHVELKLSGESKFELDNSGLVVSVQSAWYVTKDGGRELFETAKLWIAALLYKEGNE